MSVLLDTNNIMGNYVSSQDQCGGVPFSADVPLRTVDIKEGKIMCGEAKGEGENLARQKICCGLVSTPTIASEDDDSILVDRVDDDSTAATVATATSTSTSASTDCCNHDLESRSKKRRLENTERSDLVVVLDMDECLIHFMTQDGEGGNQSQLDSDSKVEDDRENIGVNGTSKSHPSVIHVNNNKVFLRPGLINFLKFVTTRFETHIFTAGTKDYADSILDSLCLLLGDEDAFSKRWYRDDCDTIDILDPFTTFCIDSIYVKPLSKVAEWVGRDADDLRRIVHVDDQARNFLLNHGNGIRVSEWRGDNPHDSALSEVTKVLRMIDDGIAGDVRPYLRNESYLTLKDHLDMLNLFPHRRTKGIGLTLL